MKFTRVAAMFCLAILLVASGCSESNDDDTPEPPDEPLNPGEGGEDDASMPEPDATVDASEPDASEPDAAGPPDTSEPDLVDYATEIQPILDQMCTHCHGGPMPRKNLDLTTHAGALSKVMPCDCAASLLIQKIGPNPPSGNRMPADGPPYLTDAEQLLICRWVDEGALETPMAGACD